MVLISCPDCKQSVSDAASACIFCGRPNPQTDLAIASPDHFALAPPTTSSKGPDSRRLFYPISLKKLAVMYLLTFGVYVIPWFYGQWDYIRDVDHRRFNPAMHAIFAGIFAYPLFRSIRTRIRAAGGHFSYAPELLFTVWLVFSISGNAIQRLPRAFLVGWLIFAVSLIPILLVQRDINEMNSSRLIDSHYSKLCVGAAALGSVVLALDVIGTIVLAWGS